MCSSCNHFVICAKQHRPLPVVMRMTLQRLRVKTNLVMSHTHSIPCCRAYASGEQDSCPTLFTEAFTYSEPKIFDREYAIVDTRGIAIPVSITLAAVRDRDDVVTGLIVTFRDVTELVRLEEARVSFLSSASHQLRTPLTSMRWSLEMLTDGSLGEIA